MNLIVRWVYILALAGLLTLFLAVALVALLYVGYRRLLPGTERPAEKV